MKKRFVVSIAVDARIDVEVDADNIEEAMDMVRDGNYDYNLGDIEFIDDKPVNIKGDGQFKDF